MTHWLEFLVIPFSAFAFRAGGGGFSFIPPLLGKILYALCFAAPCVQVLQYMEDVDPAQFALRGMLCVVTILWALIWACTGHATAYQMAAPDAPDYRAEGRTEFLDGAVDPVCTALHWPLSSHDMRYCWLFMALKGFLIHSSLGPLAGLAGACAWPTAYLIGNRIIPDIFPGLRKFGHETVAEYTAGAFSGIIIYSCLT